MRSQRGFTLIELLAVIAIIGILAGLVAGTVTGIGSTSQNARLAGDQNTLGKAADRFFTDAFPQAYPVVSLDATDDSLNPVNDPRLSTDLGVRLIDFDATLPQNATKSFVPDFLKEVPETAGLVSWRIDTNTGNAFFAEDGAFLARPSSARFDVDPGSTRTGALESTATGDRSDYTLTLVMKKGDAALDKIEVTIPEGYIIGGQALGADDVVGTLAISFDPDNSWDSGETIDITLVPVKVVSTNVWKAVVNYDSNLSTGVSPNVEVKEGSAVQQEGSARPIPDIRTHTINVTPPVGDSPGKLVITMDRSNEDVDGGAVYTDADANEATETFRLELFGTVGSTTLIKNPSTKAVYRWLAKQQTAIAVDDTFERLAGNQAVVIKPATVTLPVDSGDGEPINEPPIVTITSPVVGPFTNLDSVSFVATASDAEDGDLTDSLVWTLGTGAAIGFGGSVSATFAEGEHTITASVIDSGALSGSDEITITVAPVAVPPPSGLVSWWPGEGDGNDIVYGNDGVVGGTTFASGKVGQAFSFDGVDDKVSIPTSASLNIQGAMTFEFWTNAEFSSFDNFNRVIQKGHGTGQVGYGCASPFGGNPSSPFVEMNCWYTPLSGAEIVKGMPIPSDNAWHHIAMVYDASDVIIYLDGINVTFESCSYCFGFGASDDEFAIGNRAGATDQPFDGLIDEVSIYDRALIAAEIQSIFNASSAGKIKPTTLLEDNFDSENGGAGVLNYFGFAKWDVTVGTVDLIGNSFFDFFPGNGLYLDLDGSTASAGTLVSKTTFTLDPGEYQLKFDLAGSPAGDTNTVTVKLVDVYSEDFTRPGNAPFATVIRSISVLTPTSGKLIFEHAGGDNMGLLLDNVTLLKQ